MISPRLVFFLAIVFLVPPLSAGVPGSIQVESDLPGVAIFLNGTYIGDTPQSIRDLEPGQYRIDATLTGRQAQSREISVGNNTPDREFFTFDTGQPAAPPGLVRIYDCVGTPEQTGLYGTSVTVISMPEGNLMAFYSGTGDGVRCAGSEDGFKWHEYPGGCLQVAEGSDNARFPFSRPWVFDGADGGYRMIYLADDGTGPTLFHASSEEGAQFTPDGRVTISQTENTGSKPDHDSIPTGIRLSDGTLRMYYTAGGGIRSALSGDDGRTWEDENGYRLMAATDPTVIRLPDNRVGLFFVDLSAGFKGQKLKVTPSSDGLLFNATDAMEVIGSEEKGVWILDPELYVSKNGTWNLYFSLLGRSGETGITLPTIMRSVIDSECLMTRLSGSAE